MVPPLPVEILQIIFRSLRYFSSTLCKVALASKTFNNIVQPLLFHTLQLTNQLDENREPKRLDRQITTIRTYPHLYSLVRHLSLSETDYFATPTGVLMSRKEMESQREAFRCQWQSYFDLVGDVLRVAPIIRADVGYSLCDIMIEGTRFIQGLRVALEGGILQCLALSIPPNSVNIPPQTFETSGLRSLIAALYKGAASELLILPIIRGARDTLRKLKLTFPEDVTTQPTEDFPVLARISALSLDHIETLDMLAVPPGCEEHIRYFLTYHPSLISVRLHFSAPADHTKFLPMPPDAMPRLSKVQGDLPVVIAILPGRPVHNVDECRAYATLEPHLESLIDLFVSAVAAVSAPIKKFSSDISFELGHLERLVRAIPSVEHLSISVDAVSRCFDLSRTTHSRTSLGS